MNISGLIAAYGYWAVFALVAAESHGIPLPGETALIIAAAYAGHTHQLSPWIIFAVASAGTVTGDNIGFWIGHKGGYRLARRYGPKVRLDERKLKIAHYLFDTHGPKVVFLARFASMLRTYAAFLAGTSRMRWHRFLLANAAGAIAWAGSYTPAAYLAGDALRRLSGTIDLVIGGAAGLGLAAALLLILRRHTGTLALRAESRPPRPAQLTGLVMDDARCEAVFATGKQRPEPDAPGAGRVAQATVHPSPDHHRPARSPPPSCMASQRYHQAGAPTGPPAQPARRWRCIMCQHQPPCPPGRDRPPGGARGGVSSRAGMEPALQRHRAVRGHRRVASRRPEHPAAPGRRHERARPVGPDGRGAAHGAPGGVITPPERTRTAIHAGQQPAPDSPHHTKRKHCDERLCHPSPAQRPAHYHPLALTIPRSFWTVYRRCRVPVRRGATRGCGQPPLSNLRIIAHLDFSRGQTPENLALMRGGSADVTFAEAAQVAQVSPTGQMRILAQLPQPTGGAACPVLGPLLRAPALTVGIVRDHRRTLYVALCTGSPGLQGIWRISPAPDRRCSVSCSGAWPGPSRRWPAWAASAPPCRWPPS